MGEMPKGGARPGAGRKSYNISEKEKKKLLSAARRIQKETGKAIADILLGVIYEAKTEQIKLAAIRLYYDVITVKEGFKTVEKHDYGPLIGLPPIKERPKEPGYFIPVDSKKLS
jgi:hypothetical protein